MTVAGIDVLERFSRKHPDARTPLEDWLRLTEQAEWQNLMDVRRTFPSADGVPLKRGRVTAGATVFNIAGNKYRLITSVSFEAQAVLIRFVLTHAEYDKQSWKQRF